jgi:hypothetical protein
MFDLTGNITCVRYLHTSARLNNGKVLLTGVYSYNVGFLNTAKLYDPTMATFALPRLGGLHHRYDRAA